MHIFRGNSWLFLSELMSKYYPQKLLFYLERRTPFSHQLGGRVHAGETELDGERIHGPNSLNAKEWILFGNYISNYKTKNTQQGSVSIPSSGSKRKLWTRSDVQEVWSLVLVCESVVILQKLTTLALTATN